MCNIIGHRGAITYAPENTISSIYALKKIKCDWIEADVILTKDEYPIMFHDENLDRLTNFKGSINEYNYNEIKDVKINNSNCKIPSLKEFIEKCSELSINILLELKVYHNEEKQLVNKVIDIIKNYNSIYINICSYSIKVLQYLNIINPNKNITYIVDKIPNNWYDIIKENKCYGISINYDYNSLNDIKLCIDKIPTYCFTINKSEDFNNIVNSGIKGIITDIPELFIKDIT
tara:strand:- start:808 stop:1503 length:696 start_codon:yes stop_codon:yes gene_type:complete